MFKIEMPTIEEKMFYKFFINLRQFIDITSHLVLLFCYLRKALLYTFLAAGRYNLIWNRVHIKTIIALINVIQNPINQYSVLEETVITISERNLLKFFTGIIYIIDMIPLLIT